MHIAILSTSYPLRSGSSSGIFVSCMVDALPDIIEKTIITPCPDYRVQPDVNNGMTVKCFRYAPLHWQLLAHQPGGIPVALRKHRWLALLLPVLLISMLISCLRVARNVDLIHANWSLNGLVAGIAGKLTATPVITTLRGSDVARLEQSLVRRIVLYGCLRTNCRIVTVNNTIKNAVCNLYPRYSSRVATIANGVDENFLAIPAAKSRDHRVTRITSIGNLNPNKSMQTILEALPLVKGNPEISLRIVGDGPERDSLQLQATRTANDHISIELPGSVAPDVIPPILADTDIFILASRTEGRPNVILEAMAAGLPVLASDIDGIRELVAHEETGLLFQVDDPSSLADQIERLLGDPALLSRLGQAGRRYITSSRLTWGRCAADYHATYNACIQGAATD